MIDVNAYLGPFAFRRLRDRTAPALLRRMDRAGIARACVSSAAAITYRNAQAGNEEVFEDVKGHGDRFIPFAVLNPAYAGWREDLAICHERFGMRGVRLYPRWHNYRLTSPECRALVAEAARHGMVLSIPLRVEDRRQQSWLVDVPDVDKEEIAALVADAPEARFILVNGSGYLASRLGRPGLPANYVMDIALLSVELANEAGALLRVLGPDRLVFGTGIPFHYPEPALVKLELLDVSSDVKEKIRRGNAARWL
ncbi:MAG: amidohydrolase family protein [Bryobacterales bacterium]|nr:amidohydrolase family protein [Bryobacterales bacterium]